MPYGKRRLEASAEKRERLFIKLSLGIFLALIAFVALCWAGRTVYVRWQEKRLVLRGNLAYDHGDYRSASLAARTALSIRPASIGASRLLAEITEQAHDRTAIEWRRKVAALDPKSTQAKVEWAKAAILFEDLDSAGAILDRVPEFARESPSYHATRALLAQARHDDAAAESEWGKAIALAPNETSYRLQMGVQQLRSEDPSRHAAGRKILEDLAESARDQTPALRALIADGLQRKIDGGDLVILARQLANCSNALLADKIMYLDFMHQAHDPGFSQYLTDMETSSAKDPVALTQLLSWMSVQNLNLIALDYLKTLPPATENEWPVPLAMANVYVRLREWQKLVALTKGGRWKQEFLQHAFLSRALREQQKDADARTEWAAGVRDASSGSEKLAALLNLTTEWRWEPESLDLLWELSKHPDKQREAATTLYQRYAKAKDTPGLHRVLVRLSELEPDDLNIQNNLAQISMLLNAQTDEARRIAAEIHKKNPSNPAYASTFAYALLTAGRVSEALKVMNSLSDAQRNEPATAAYYGLCLAAAKDPKAREFLERGKSASLLPEERALVDEALTHLR
jgi:predicted Zn-dependent protease